MKLNSNLFSIVSAYYQSKGFKTMEGMTKQDQLLDREDIDALLSRVGQTEEGEPVDSESITGFGVPDKISDEYFSSLAVRIYKRSLFLREPGVQVIWNALNTLPMNTGMNLNIQGMEYKTLGVLHAKHLVVKTDS
jgi:hypothetical protein